MMSFTLSSEKGVSMMQYSFTLSSEKVVQGEYAGRRSMMQQSFSLDLVV